MVSALLPLFHTLIIMLFHLESLSIFESLLALPCCLTSVLSVLWSAHRAPAYSCLACVAFPILFPCGWVLQLACRDVFSPTPRMVSCRPLLSPTGVISIRWFSLVAGCLAPACFVVPWIVPSVFRRAFPSVTRGCKGCICRCCALPVVASARVSVVAASGSVPIATFASQEVFLRHARIPPVLCRTSLLVDSSRRGHICWRLACCEFLKLNCCVPFDSDHHLVSRDLLFPSHTGTPLLFLSSSRFSPHHTLPPPWCCSPWSSSLNQQPFDFFWTNTIP